MKLLGVIALCVALTAFVIAFAVLRVVLRPKKRVIQKPSGTFVWHDEHEHDDD